MPYVVNNVTLLMRCSSSNLPLGQSVKEHDMIDRQFLMGVSSKVSQFTCDVAEQKCKIFFLSFSF